MKSKKIGLWFGIAGFVLSIPAILLILFGATLVDTVTGGGVGQILFWVLSLPSLLGFITSITSIWTPKLSGVFMILSGLIILVPGLIFGTIFFGLFTAMLYLIGGVLSLTR